MSVNDLKVFASPYASVGTNTWNVAASATIIYPGEPVARAQGGIVVTQMATAKPVIKTDFLEGIAMSTSTNTAAVAGTVDVMPLLPGIIYLAKPTTAALWATQALYNAYVGQRMVMALAAGAFTMGTTDGATNGCIIMPLDVAKYPGVVAFTFASTVWTASFQD